MVIFGIGQGLGLSSLTTAGMARVPSRDAGVAGGLVNVSHHLGGAVGLGVLVTVFAAAGQHQHGATQLATRVSSSLTAGSGFVAAALLITLTSQYAARRRRSTAAPTSQPILHACDQVAA
jgi:sugar phosphate permease